MYALNEFPKIDAHFHATHDDPVYEEMAEDFNIGLLNINTDADIFPPLDIQEAVAIDYSKKNPARFSYLTSFEMRGWQEAGWQERTIDRISKSMETGAVGVKLWKNIGMEIRKPVDGTFLLIDDPCFEPIFTFLQQHAIPVLTHLGEPKNCWLPLEQMTSKRNRHYYAQHPEFHAYLHPEIPSYETQIAARDNVVARYPQLTFIGAHLGSLEWSYHELAKRFDNYPNFHVDLSSRLGHLLIQSTSDYSGVRNFFIRYADRIMYGTDAYNNPRKLKDALANDWQFLTTAQACVSTEVDGTFTGINLPEEVLYKVYYGNAKRIYSRLALDSIK